MQSESIVMIVGPPASGKSTHAERFLAAPGRSHIRLNRDTTGGSLEGIARRMEYLISEGHRLFLLDNTYHTRQSRKPICDLGRKHGIPLKCEVMDTTIEQAQVNACRRMIQRYGKLLMPEDIKAVSRKDPNIFPPAVLFKYRKEFEMPSLDEGFSLIEMVPFTPRMLDGHTGKAVILDYDGTLRETKNGAKYPVQPNDIRVLPGRAETLRRYAAGGYRLLGVSNQSGVADGKLSLDAAIACFERTNKLLGLDIEYAFCPHAAAPIGCYCRKPMPGLGVRFIERHKLDPWQTIVVGDRTTDRTFADRAGKGYMDKQGLKYVDRQEFFRA